MLFILCFGLHHSFGRYACSESVSVSAEHDASAYERHGESVCAAHDTSVYAAYDTSVYAEHDTSMPASLSEAEQLAQAG